MSYTNGLDKGAFLQYMFEEFPSVFNNFFAREMLANIVDYGTADNFTHTKNELYYYLKDMIPEVEPKDILPFMDKEMLTDEVLSLMCGVEDKIVDDLITDATRKSNDLADKSNRCAVIRVFFDGVHVDNVFANFDDVDCVCNAILDNPFADVSDNAVKEQWLKENGGASAPVITFEIDDDGPEYHPEKDIEKD